MKPLLEELAEKIISQHPRLEEVTIVFPNRRAALFFHHYLSIHLTQPAWSPKLKTIEELFHELSGLQEADRLSLIFKLYRVYRKLINKEESFDQFYFWGEMLLRDFEEVDKYLIPAAMLFKDLSQLRELDESFDYLTEEQKKFLQVFWDLDAYYVEDSNQEAGQFFRQYSKHSVLSATFDPALASNFMNAERKVALYGVPQK